MKNNEIMQEFLKWSNDPKNNLAKLHQLLLKANEEINPDEKLIVEFTRNHFSGTFVTNTEVQEALADFKEVFINHTPLGKILKANFVFKSIRRGEKIYKAYFIK